MNSSDQNSHRNLARPTTVQTCGNCGLPRHPAGKPYPGKGKTCAFCGKLNHYASVCRQKSKSANEVRRSFVNPIPEEPRINRITPGHPTIQLLSTCDEHTVVCRNPTITVRILNSRKPGRNTAATADTSACATILGTDLYQDMGMKLNELSDRGADTLSAVDGFRLQSIGRMALDLEHRATPSGRRQLSVRGVDTSLRLQAYSALSNSNVVASTTLPTTATGTVRHKSHAIPDAPSRPPFPEPPADDADDHVVGTHKVRAVLHGIVAGLSATNNPNVTSPKPRTPCSQHCPRPVPPTMITWLYSRQSNMASQYPSGRPPQPPSLLQNPTGPVTP